MAPVVLVEDAHAVPGAQYAVEKILTHFGERYPFAETAVEGTAGPFDALLFRTFPSKIILGRVVDYYIDEGELPGTAAFAIRRKGSASVNGMENMSLYEEDINAYLEAGPHREKLQEELSVVRELLNVFKQEHYAPELLELDRALESFHEGADNLGELAALMAQTGQTCGVPLTKEYYPDLFALARLAEAENGISPAVTHEIGVLVEQLRSKLANFPRTLEFNSRLQAYQTEQLSAEDFLEYILEVAEGIKINLKLSSALKERLERHRRAGAIKGARLFEELERYAGYLKARMTATPEEEEAERLSRAVYLLSGLLEFKLSRGEWRELKLLAEKGFTLSRPGSGLGQAAEKIDFLLMEERRAAPFFNFYRTAEEREEAFFEHLRGADVRNGVSVAVAGGFHTQGLAEILRKEKIPYAVVTPAILSLPERNHYASHMKGVISWSRYFTEENGRISVRKAFARAAAMRLLTAAREEAGTQGLPILLKKWRENLIAALVAENRLEELADYTQELEDVSEKLVGEEAEERARAAWLKKVETFAAGLKEIDTGVSGSEEKIAGLFRAPAAAAWSSSMLFTRNTAPAAWRRGEPDSSGRSELRVETTEPQELRQKMEAAILSLRAAYDHPDLPAPKRSNRRRIKELSESLGGTVTLVTAPNPDEKKKEIIERSLNDLKKASAVLKELKMADADFIENQAPAETSGDPAEKSEVRAGYIDNLLRSAIEAKSYPLKTETLLRIRNVSLPTALAELQAITREQRPVEERIAAVLMLGLVGPSARETVAYLRELRRAKAAGRGRAANEWHKLQEAAAWALEGILKNDGLPVPVHLLESPAYKPAPEPAVILPFTPERLKLSEPEKLMSVITGFASTPESREEAVRSLAALGIEAIDDLIGHAENHAFLQGRVGAILALGLMGESASGTLERLNAIRVNEQGDPEKFDAIRAAAAWAEDHIRGETREPPPYQLMRSEMRAVGEEKIREPEEIRRELFFGEALVFGEAIRGAILSLVPEPVLTEIKNMGTSPEQLAWKMNGRWVDVPDRNARWFIQIDRSPAEGILILSVVPVLSFPGGLLRDYAPVYLPLQDAGDGQLKFLVGGRLSQETLQIKDEIYSRNPISFWLEKNLDSFSRRFGFTAHWIQPLGIPTTALTALGFQKQESGDYVRSVPDARSELRLNPLTLGSDEYDTVLRNLVFSETGPVNIQTAIPAVLTLIREDGPETAAGRLVELAEDPAYMKLYEGLAETAAAAKYTALEDIRRKHPGYDTAASAWTRSLIESLPAQAEAYFTRMKKESAGAKELNYSFAFPTDGSPMVREWLLQLLETVRKLQAHPEYGAHVHANIRVLVTRDELMDPSLKDFFTMVGRSPSAKVLEISSVASAAVQLRGFLEQHSNALAYGVEDYPLSGENTLRLVRSDVDAERTFPVAVLLAQRLAEVPGITPELLRNMTAEISSIVGFDGRGLHISTLAYEIALEYTIDQLIGSMA